MLPQRDGYRQAPRMSDEERKAILFGDDSLHMDRDVFAPKEYVEPAPARPATRPAVVRTEREQPETVAPKKKGRLVRFLRDLKED